MGGGKSIIEHSTSAPIGIVPHPRTLRNAREQIKVMVATGFSTKQIRRYLQRWALWWRETSETWQITEMLAWFIAASTEAVPTKIAITVLEQIKQSYGSG